jgi:hypothetical protein
MEKFYPNILTVEEFLRTASENQACINGKWLPVRFLGWGGMRNRLRAAWLVFTGRADALVWPTERAALAPAGEEG